ncbi:MAG: basic amino acid ABC transporter substrate-binding protein [Clostridia bacterium]|nr:basic amino acid ABC transporter substrate-binding protein [Clostridia bacterium]
MKKILALLLTVAMLLSATIVFASCSEKEDKVLVMATNATFPPYEYIGEGDKIVGIDAEIAAEIAKKLDMTLEIKDVDFGSILGGVKGGKYDIGMAGMTVTPDRLKEVNFTTSYAKGVQVIIVKADSGITSAADLTGKKIGVQQDTTGDIYASDTVENGGFGDENVTRYKSGNDAVLALTSGKIDAVIIDKEPANSYVKTNEGLTILETPYADEDYAIAVSKDNPELLQKVNKALEELIADGTVAAIINKYIPAEG